MKKGIFKEAWNWTKEHKKGIILSVVTVVGGVVLYKAGASYVERVVKPNMPLPNPEGFVPEIDVGVVGDYARYPGGVVDLWMDKVRLGDMGKLGEELVEQIPDLSENSTMFMITNIFPEGEAT